MHMAIDQYGVAIYGLVHPRKDLLLRVGGGRVSKMYWDRLDGTTRHVGYVIGNRWFTIYTVEPWEGKERP